MTYAGTRVTEGGRSALRFERLYRHPVERVWRAVTEPQEMAQWFPSEVEGRRAVGAALVFADEAQRAAAREAGEPTRADGPELRGTVVAYEPPRLFSFTWGGELLRLELAPDGDGTRLVFTHVLSHESVAARNGAGWHACLAGLDRLLAAPEPPGVADWEAVYADYLDRMGPSLGVPRGDGAMTWERATHVDAARVREACHEPGEVDAWGGTRLRSDAVRWEVVPEEHGTVYRLTHTAVGDDAELAAQWHALLVQLDLYLAAGMLVPVDHTRWVAAYKAVL
jgi:uncharacterized protein YndB with AHSA1/START domain